MKFGRFWPLLVVLLFLLAACGGQTPDPVDTPSIKELEVLFYAESDQIKEGEEAILYLVLTNRSDVESDYRFELLEDGSSKTVTEGNILPNGKLRESYSFTPQPGSRTYTLVVTSELQVSPSGHQGLLIDVLK